MGKKDKLGDFKNWLIIKKMRPGVFSMVGKMEKELEVIYIRNIE